VNTETVYSDRREAGVVMASMFKGHSVAIPDERRENAFSEATSGLAVSRIKTE